MAIQFHPEPGTILACDFAGFRPVISTFVWQIIAGNRAIDCTGTQVGVVLQRLALIWRLPIRFAECYKSAMDETKRSPAPETREVDATVVALVPEYHQAKIRSNDGFLYSITERTLGVTLAALKEGQHVRATVTIALPRVLRAYVIA